MILGSAFSVIGHKSFFPMFFHFPIFLKQKSPFIYSPFLLFLFSSHFKNALPLSFIVSDEHSAIKLFFPICSCFQDFFVFGSQ